MITLKQAVVVEGKYDKIKLSNFINATIIVTNGFRIFKDLEKRKLIQLFANNNGIIVMTDSDSAGAVIRSHIKQICPSGSITNIYLPQLSGKEKRKDKPSKEGFLGVEGLSKQVIIEALERSEVNFDAFVKSDKKITKTDLFVFGLSGCENSNKLRENLSNYLNLPSGMTANAFLDCVNTIYGYDEFKKAVSLWQQEADKR